MAQKSSNLSFDRFSLSMATTGCRRGNFTVQILPRASWAPEPVGESALPLQFQCIAWAVIAPILGVVGIPRGGFTPDETDAVNGVREDGDNINTLSGFAAWIPCLPKSWSSSTLAIRYVMDRARRSAS